MNEEKPPPRVCPRCNSDNTKFCYYNNHSLSQPRYSCKNCRRYWTHGGALRNIPIGGSSRKKSTNSQPSASHVNSVNLQQQGNHQQSFLNIQENNGFLGSFGDSSSSVGNHYGNHYRSFPEIHGDPRRNFGPMEASNFTEGSFQQNYFDVGSNDLIGNPLINQLTGEHVYDYNGFHVNQEDLNVWNHSFNNTMNMDNIESTSGWNHSFNNTMNMDNMESTSGSRGSPVINKCILRSPYHFEKHGP